MPEDGPFQAKRMNLLRLPETQKFLLLVAGLMVSAGFTLRTLDSSGSSLLIPIGGLIYLGQACLTGLFYLGAFDRTGSAPGVWRGVLDFVPLTGLGGGAS